MKKIQIQTYSQYIIIIKGNNKSLFNNNRGVGSVNKAQKRNSTTKLVQVTNRLINSVNY